MKSFDYYFCPVCGEDRRAADKRERMFALLRRPMCPDCGRPLLQSALGIALDGLVGSLVFALVFADWPIVAGLVLLGSALIAAERWARRRAARRSYAAGQMPSEVAGE